MKVKRKMKVISMKNVTANLKFVLVFRRVAHYFRIVMQSLIWFDLICLTRNLTTFSHIDTNFWPQKGQKMENLIESKKNEKQMKEESKEALNYKLCTTIKLFFFLHTEHDFEMGRGRGYKTEPFHVDSVWSKGLKLI